MVDFCQLQQFVREGNTVATSKATEEETEDQICLLSKKIEMEQVKSKTPRVFPLFADSLGGKRALLPTLQLFQRC